jgi:hypothetical protein
VSTRVVFGPRKEENLRELSVAAAGALMEREGIDLLRNAKSCEPEGPQDLTQRL